MSLSILFRRNCSPFFSTSAAATTRRRRLAPILRKQLALGCGLLLGSTVALGTIRAEQAETSRRSGYDIALIDVAYLFKHAPSIEAQTSKVKADLKRFDEELKQQRETLQRSAAQLKTLKIGTAEYARQEEQLASMEANLRLDVTRKQQQLREAEAKLYYDNYQRIVSAVRAIANHNQIKLVLRFNSQEIDGENSESVGRGVMRNVVYHDSAINMTDSVMHYLEQQSQASRAAGSGTAASAVRR